MAPPARWIEPKWLEPKWLLMVCSMLLLLLLLLLLLCFVLLLVVVVAVAIVVHADDFVFLFVYQCEGTCDGAVCVQALAHNRFGHGPGTGTGA